MKTLILCKGEVCSGVLGCLFKYRSFFFFIVKNNKTCSLEKRRCASGCGIEVVDLLIFGKQKRIPTFRRSIASCIGLST